MDGSNHIFLQREYAFSFSQINVVANELKQMSQSMIFRLQIAGGKMRQFINLQMTNNLATMQPKCM